MRDDCSELARVMALCKAYELCKDVACHECGSPAPFLKEITTGAVVWCCSAHYDRGNSARIGLAKAVDRLMQIAKGE